MNKWSSILRASDGHIVVDLGYEKIDATDEGCLSNVIGSLVNYHNKECNATNDVFKTLNNKLDVARLKVEYFERLIEEQQKLIDSLTAAPTGGCSRCVYRPTNGEPCDRCNVVTDCFATTLEGRKCNTCKRHTNTSELCESCFDGHFYYYWEPKEGGGTVTSEFKPAIETPNHDRRYALLHEIYLYYGIKYEVTPTGAVNDFDSEKPYMSVNEALLSMLPLMRESNESVMETGDNDQCPVWTDEEISFIESLKEGGGELVEGGQCDNDCTNCDSHICCPTPAPSVKGCDSCKHRDVHPKDLPCFGCRDKSSWEPKETPATHHHECNGECNRDSCSLATCPALDAPAPPDELFKCQVCGKLIRADEGITTLNGWWVCDNDSCRTLDDENEATEIPYKKWEPTTDMERRLLEVKDGLHQLLDIFLLKGIAVDALPTESIIALREMDCTNCNHKLRKFSEYPCNECMAYKTDYEKWEYPNHRDKSCGECEYVNRERNQHPCDICLASRMGSEWKPKEPVPINERKCPNCKHKRLKFDTAPCSECLSYKTNYSKWEWEGREWSTKKCLK